MEHPPASQSDRSLLRLMICGAANVGKSTLIGRLLWEGKENKAAIDADSGKSGTQEDDPDFALVLDALAAEREEGITSEAVYHSFASEVRKFIVADTPGQERHTRSMVTSASTADAAVLMVDARHGLLTQTRRQAYLVSLVGIRHVVLAVNKMDLVDWNEALFRHVESEVSALAERLGLLSVQTVPVSALRGDNLLHAASRAPWYTGPTLMAWLHDVEVDATRLQGLPLRLPVQWVNGRSAELRGYLGLIASGVVRVGDRVRVQPAGSETTVQRIVTAEGEVSLAVAGQSVTVTLSDKVDVLRGDVLSQANAPAEVADQFEASIVWMHDEPLLPGRTYLLKIGTRTASASVTNIKYQVNVDTLEQTAAKTLALNAIGVCTLHLDQPVPFDPYTDNRDMGGFILIDRMSSATVGTGMLHFALRRSHNIHLQRVEVDKTARNRLNGQQGCVLWLTGLSGAGKSTIANAVEKRLHSLGYRTYLLDGDNVRHGLNKDLGFTDQDRVENIRRVAEVAKLMVDAGLIVLSSFISPFRAERAMARAMMQPGEFFELHVDVPLEVAESRDPKGLYRKARRGELKHFTGIDSEYQPPDAPELRLLTSKISVEDAVERIVSLLTAHARLQPPS